MKAGTEVGAMMSPKDVAGMYGVTSTELARWRRTGDGPAFFVLGRNTVRYDADDVAEWFNDVLNAHLHDYPAGR
ncbi:hypothetical protein IWX75_003470 [Arthrobacter sp. CAN_A6]|uniref:helix-turn-helix transcriptional regulator n=1 Tax=Arthrobacter sp. CAN_A6 TaxID=2787721 RepID=UPI001A21E3C8